MKTTKSIIITGPPCSGKSTIAKVLGEKLSLPIFSKDMIKESLFDSLGWKDREWSKGLGKASYPILYSIIESNLKANKSFIVESNFSPEYDNIIFKDFKSKYDCDFILINCVCDGKILLERFERRANSGDRHPGHLDHLNISEFKESLLKGGIEGLDLGKKSLEVDTTDFDALDLSELIGRVEALLK